MSRAIPLTKGLCSDQPGVASVSSSSKKLIDYTKNRARFVGERRRKRSSMCSDFQTTIDRTTTRATEEEEEATSISTAGSADLVVFYLRKRFRRVVDDDLESQIDKNEGGRESHVSEVDEDLVSHVSESETPSEGAHFGYLPGAIRNTADMLSSPRPLRPSLRKPVEDCDESSRSLGSATEKDHSSASYYSDSECSSHITSIASQGNSSMRSSSCRSVRSYESLELGLLSHGFVNKRGGVTDSSQSSVVSSSFPNHEENKSFRSMCSRSATGRSLDSLASNLLKTPTSHNRGKSHINVSLSGGYLIRSNHVHTPSSVKKSKYLLPFTPCEGDQDMSQRSTRPSGGTRSGRRGDRTISLKDFFRKEEVKRFNPESSKQSMKSLTQKPTSQSKTKSSEMTPRRKRAISDVSAPETPVTASMTSQTMSTPSNRSGMLRSFSFSDKGNSLLAELNQNLKQGLLCDFDDDDELRDDDASVANSEALASLMDGLRSISKSTRALDVSGADCFDDCSSHLDHTSLARSANETPFLSRSHLDLDSSQSETDSMERITKAAMCSAERLSPPSRTDSLRCALKYTEKEGCTHADDREPFKEIRGSVDNHGDTLSAAISGRRLCARRIHGKGTTATRDDKTQSENLVNTESLPSIESIAPQAGFLIQPKVLPLRTLPKGILRFAPLDCHDR